MKERASILRYLEVIANVFPAPLYWTDLNHVVLGGNNHVTQAIGLGTIDKLIGKSAFELYPKEIAENITKHNDQVIKTNKVLFQEEMIVNVSTGELNYFTAYKSPLHDDDGNIIGVLGTSIDLTAEKKAEQLTIQSEKQEQSIKEQKKFVKEAEQLAHDIRSPLSSLIMIVDGCQQIPEAERIGLREAAMGASDIADSFLARHKNKEKKATKQTTVDAERGEPVLISALLLQLLSEKKYEYKGTGIKLSEEFNEAAYFAFINVGRVAFKRMISNLMNNARDALSDNGSRNAEINVSVMVDHDQVNIIIKDNGKGMPASVIEKVRCGISVTAGKAEGHGIGLIQVRETLACYHGKIDIISTVGEGTEIVLTFPKVPSPDWIGEKINLQKNDTVIVLDDDNSIHTAWDLRFNSFLNNTSNVDIRHFDNGGEALAFIQHLSDKQKEAVFLLSDFELLNQDYDGLDIIEQSKIARHLLVTSHDKSEKVRSRAAKLGVKILPKQLAYKIKITLDESNRHEEDIKEEYEVVVIDDNAQFGKILCNTMFASKNTKRYENPLDFLAEVDQYGKGTLMLIDNNYDNVSMKGADIAEKLHQQGYKKLYLLSGSKFSRGDLPDYLTPILKTDIAALKKLVN